MNMLTWWCRLTVRGSPTWWDPERNVWPPFHYNPSNIKPKLSTRCWTLEDYNCRWWWPVESDLSGRCSSSLFQFFSKLLQLPGDVVPLTLSFGTPRPLRLQRLLQLLNSSLRVQSQNSPVEAAAVMKGPIRKLNGFYSELISPTWSSFIFFWSWAAKLCSSSIFDWSWPNSKSFLQGDKERVSRERNKHTKLYFLVELVLVEKFSCQAACVFLLLQSLFQLFLLVLQVPHRVHGQLQICLQLPFGSFQIYAHLLLQLQGTFHLQGREGGGLVIEREYLDLVGVPKP